MRLCMMTALMPVNLEELEQAGITTYQAMTTLGEMWLALQDIHLTDSKVDGYTKTETVIRESIPSLKDLDVDEWFVAKHHYLLTDFARVPNVGEHVALGNGPRDPFLGVTNVMWMPGGTPLVRLMMAGFFLGTPSEQARWEKRQALISSDWIESGREYGLYRQDLQADWDNMDWDLLNKPPEG